MKTINYFSGSLLALLFYALFAACNNDLQTIAVTEIKGIEQTLLNESNTLISSDVATDSTMLGKDNTISNSTSATNAFFTKQEYEEGMDWCKDREGDLPALYEYQVSCRDFPSGHGPDTCIYYMTIIWTCYPPITEANWMDYQYMQVQHRLISGTTAFPWRYLGEGGPGNYNYGIVKVNGFQDPMDLNATHLPTRVQFRYRLLHKDFPGKADKSINDKEKWYNKNLATGWHYKDYNQPTYNNPYGYNSQDFNNMESLKFIINDPKCGSSFSVRVLVDGYLVFPQLVGGRYEVTVPKFRKTGEYLITAEYAGNVSEEFKTAVRHGIYQKYTSKEIYIMFSCNEFSYD